jgi:hypothetical protein
MTTARTRVLVSATAADAKEFGLHVKQGGWRLGLLVARNVVKSPGRVSIESLSPKTNATRFAQLAETSNDRVLRYLNAWEQAADADLVPHANDLSPTSEPDLDVDTLPSWSQYYRPEVRRTSRPAAPVTAPVLRGFTVAVTTVPADDLERQQAEAAEVQRREAEERDRRRVMFEEAAVARRIEDAEARRSHAESQVEAAGQRYRSELNARDRQRQAMQNADTDRTSETGLAVHQDMALEVSELVGKAKWFTRRLFDLARDPEWLTVDNTRRQASDDIRILADQLALIADLAADPDSGRLTDETASALLES